MNPNDTAILFVLVIGFIPAVISCVDMYIQGRRHVGGKFHV